MNFNQAALTFAGIVFIGLGGYSISTATESKQQVAILSEQKQQLKERVSELKTQVAEVEAKLDRVANDLQRVLIVLDRIERSKK